jgi:hypothetical protein
LNRKLDIFEQDEVKKVIDYLKTEKNITSITESGSVSTIETNTLLLLNDVSPIYLQSGQIVTISGVNYTVSNVNQTLKTFDIEATGLTAHKWNLAINYKFGTRTEINEILAIEAKNQVLSRFPLIWLFPNEAREHDSTEYDFRTGLKMSFVGMSKVEYRAEQRKELNLKPVIMPLVRVFIACIENTLFSHIFFTGYENEKLKYTEYVRYFYGSSDKNEMVLTAPTDAIEVDLDISFQNQY